MRALFLVKVCMLLPALTQVSAAHTERRRCTNVNITCFVVENYHVWSQAVLHVDRRHLDREAAKQAAADPKVRAPSKCRV